MTPHGRDSHQLLDQAPLLAATRDGPLDRSTLQDELDISRATAYRWTSALTDEQLLEQTPAGYQTTGAGCAVADAVSRFERTIAAVDQLEPLLAQISAPELTRHVHLFADADLHVATPQHPNAPIEPWLEHFTSFDRSRSLVVAGCPPKITEQGIEHAQNDVDFEAICTPLALEADRNASKNAFDTIASADAPDLYTHPGLPFTMGIIDDVVIVGGFDDETSLPVASVTTDDPEAREWAVDLYRRYKRDAVPLDLAEMNAETR
ncbi:MULTISPECIES: helix-turn-helix transcriptional regulator [Haloferax]|uniref:helix-turn-helix transcriptional regulator n=1 Tax=Haloferax TaxID=2251 RepID=UPI000B0CB050|nr:MULTISPECIES: transcriptional regulator FilR1 domain-containing protein [Haloferax]